MKRLKNILQIISYALVIFVVGKFVVFDSINSMIIDKAVGQGISPNIQEVIKIGMASGSKQGTITQQVLDNGLGSIISNIEEDPLTYHATSGASRMFKLLNVNVIDTPLQVTQATLTLPAIRMNGSHEATLHYYVRASDTRTTLVTTVEVSNNYNPALATTTNNGQWYGTDDAFWNPNNPIGTLPATNGYKVSAASSTMMNWNAGSFPGSGNIIGKSFKIRNINSKFMRVLISASENATVGVEITRD